jgi:hypothetical protein
VERHVARSKALARSLIACLPALGMLASSFPALPLLVGN